jgi:hypothetical protein
LAAILGGHARTKTMSTLAFEITGLKCSFHLINPSGKLALQLFALALNLISAAKTMQRLIFEIAT